MLLKDKLQNYRLILASASPRRRELLAACDLDFTLAEKFECEEHYPADLEADKVIAIFMNPKRIIHGNRKGIEIKRFDETTEGLEYGELFMHFRKRDGFLVTRHKKNMVFLKTAEE